MARLAACLGALVLAFAIASANPLAHASGGGASAPRTVEPSGGLGAPKAPRDGARFTQADPPEPEPPDAGPPPPAPLDGQPDEAPESDAPAPTDAPVDDRGIGIVVPLPEEAVDPQAPMTVETSVTTLPRTGQDTGALGLIGLLLIAAGGAVGALSRPRRAASA